MDPVATVDDRGGVSGPTVTASAAIPPSARSTRWTATHCEPTPRYCRGWGGDAHLGAVRSFSFGDEPYWVRITRVADSQVRTTFVLVVSNCGCPPMKGRPNIDVSLAAFRELASPGQGRIRVRVERIDGVPSGPTAPPTSTEETP